ncbi:MAG: hypothetical protein P4L61_03750 [Candidatus Pacebacteria bacterium]|nr:hypothetical protein [Candidatus Paceibacterota bacterium]
MEKVLTDRNGRQYRVLFLVSLIDGEVRGQIVSAQPIFEEAKAIRLPGRIGKGSTKHEARHDSTESSADSPWTKLCLPAVKSAAKVVESRMSSWSRVASPYFSELEFFMSQPTRAPSFK